jgi:hypothetical protein
MDQHVNPDQSSADSTVSIDRRRLLKALATGGFAVAFIKLPGQWTRPLAEVGALPIHAQVSATQPAYSGVCDSLPGGGDLRITQGAINSIQPYLQLIAGIASLQGIPATMTAEITSASAPTFNPPLPQTAATDAAGRASFGNLAVSGNPGDSFFLVFNFATPTGNIQLRCGEFFFGQTPTTK